MMLVADASVAVKWFLPEPTVETHVDRAVALLQAVRDGRVDLVEPPHWLAEIVAVATRLDPGVVPALVDLLDAMEIPVATEAAVLKRAAELSTALEHHVFDTLYHAVALERDATLVTADLRYARKARHVGGIVALADWRPPPAPAG